MMEAGRYYIEWYGQLGHPFTWGVTEGEEDIPALYDTYEEAEQELNETLEEFGWENDDEVSIEECELKNVDGEIMFRLTAWSEDDMLTLNQLRELSGRQ